MPDGATSNGTSHAASNGAPAAPAAPAAKPAKPAKNTSKPAASQSATPVGGETPGNKFAGATERIEASLGEDTSATALLDGLEGEFASTDSTDSGTTDTADTTDAGTTDETVESPEPKTEDDFDFDARRLQRDADDAAVFLDDNAAKFGIDRDTIKSLWKNNKASLINLARSLAGNTGKDQAGGTPQNQNDPLDSILGDVKKKLTEESNYEEADADAILSPLKPIVSHLRETMNAEIKKIRDEYSNQFKEMQGRHMQVEGSMARSRMESDFPQVKEESKFLDLLKRVDANVRAGVRYGTLEEGMRSAASDLWGKEKEIERRKSMTQEAKIRTNGQPTLKANPNTPAASGGKPKEVTADQRDEMIYRARLDARRAGKDDNDPDGGANARVARIKQLYTIKR